MAKKSNKRIQKKAQKKTVTKKLQTAGYTPKQQKRLTPEVKRKEVTRITRNELERNRIQTNRQRLLNDGVPLSIITAERLDRKGYSLLSKKQITEYRRRGLKLDALKQAGYKYTEVKGDLRLSVDRLIDIYSLKEIPGIEKKRGTSGTKKQPKTAFNPDIKLTGKTYLYIGYSDIDGFNIDDLTDVPDDQLKELINDMIEFAKKNPDDSSGFRGTFKVSQGSKSDMSYMAFVYYSREYNMNPQTIKMTNDSYSKITVSNKFSQRNFWEMIYTCIGQMKNSDVTDFIDDMNYYCKENNFPFMRNLKK